MHVFGVLAGADFILIILGPVGGIFVLIVLFVTCVSFIILILMLSHIITPIVEAITREYLRKKTDIHTEKDWQGDFTLRVHKFYNILGWGCATIACVPIIGFLFDPPDLLTLLIVVPSFILMFGFFAALGIMSYRNHKVVFNKTYLMVTTPLGKVKTTTWKKIVGIKFNATTGFLKLTDEDGQKLRVNQHLVGRSDFLHMLQMQTGAIVNFPD